jgi:hypothetical protein
LAIKSDLIRFKRTGKTLHNMAFVGANLPNDLGVRFAKRKASSGLEKTQLVIIALEKQAARRAARGGKKNSTKVAA